MAHEHMQTRDTDPVPKVQETPARRHCSPQIQRFRSRSPAMHNTSNQTASTLERAMEQNDAPVNNEVVSASPSAASKLVWFSSVFNFIGSNDNEHIQAQLKEAQKTNQELQQACRDLQESNNALKSKCTQAHEETKSLIQQLNSSHFEQADLRREVQCLNEVLVRNSVNENEPNDQELVDAFNDIVNEIQKISFQSILRDSAVSTDKSPQHVRDFYSKAVDSCGAKPKYMRWQLRAKIFDVLRIEILNQPYFGFPGHSDVSLSTLEQKIARGKQLRGSRRIFLTASLEDAGAVAPWRKQMIDCAKKLGAYGNGSRMVKRTNGRLFSYIDCLGHLSFATKARINKELHSLCEKSFRLMLLMRNSQSDVEVFTVSPGRPIDANDEKDLKVIGAEDGALTEEDISRSKVAYAVAGGLCKVNFRAKRRIVLEKALVIFEQ
ncbi:MAG: hypothetical protein Q9159_002121 [Coniocarpon cinnabarinum]